MGEDIAVKEETNNMLSMDIVKKYICPTATEGEIYTFLQLCKAQNLNPFLKEVYLVKYSTSPATIVVGKEAFTKRADKQPQYDGFKAGIIVISAGKIITREGSFYVLPEIVVGGWAEVHRKDRTIPFRNEVKLEEYIGKKSDGTPNKMWAEKVATMIRKVALCQSLREAFPDVMGGLYSFEEINTIEELPKYDMGKVIQIDIPSVKPATRTPHPVAQVETAQCKTEIVKVGKHKNGQSFLYKLNDKDGVVYTTDQEGFITLCGTAKNAGLQVLLTYKTDAAKTIEDIEILEPNLDLDTENTTIGGVADGQPNA